MINKFASTDIGLCLEADKSSPHPHIVIIYFFNIIPPTAHGRRKWFLLLWSSNDYMACILRPGHASSVPPNLVLLECINL